MQRLVRIAVIVDENAAEAAIRRLLADVHRQPVVDDAETAVLDERGDHVGAHAREEAAQAGQAGRRENVMGDGDREHHQNAEHEDRPVDRARATRRPPR